jgi:hypothetical protein
MRLKTGGCARLNRARDYRRLYRPWDLYESFIHPITILSTLPSAGLAIARCFIGSSDLPS